MNPLDYVDIKCIFSQYRDGLAGLSIEYYMDESIGSGGYPMDIHSVCVCISWIEYWVLYGTDIQWIFIQCMYALAWLSIEYYLDESVGSGWYSMDTQWIFTQCRYGFARLSINNVGQMNN